MAAIGENEKNKSIDEATPKPVNISKSDNDDASAKGTPADTKKNDVNEAESNSSSVSKASTTPSISTPKSNAANIENIVIETTTEPDQKLVTPKKSTPAVSNTPEPAVESLSDTRVEQQLAEMMEIDPASSDKDSDSNKDNETKSNASNGSIGDLNDLNDDSLADEMDVSDVSSSIAENENDSKIRSLKKKPKKRQPPIMIGYKKRRKVHNTSKKLDDEIKTESEIDSTINDSVDDKSTDESKIKDQSSASSDDNVSETSSVRSTRSVRKLSATCNEVSMIDNFCWICHKDGSNSLKCIACPRVYHSRCLTQQVADIGNFHCPECSAILKADNVNTRSPVMQAVNLDQLCVLLKHVLEILKNQKDAHYFYGPVDTKEFPHYREYVVYPMDLSILGENVTNKVYGCTEAFLADMKWIVHNSIVFNTISKITNVAKNLLKVCKREVYEIETCAECYYNLLVRKDTWFIEACKRPHLLIWARLKGYPPWPAKALKCKDENVDCRFFGAHDKAWVPLKDCYLYSKVSPMISKIKPGGNLDEGIQEIEKHIKKLKEKYGTFVYPEYKVPYNPNEELEQLQQMLPYYNPNKPISGSKPAATHVDQRSKTAIKPKTLFNESTSSTTSSASGKSTPPASGKSTPTLRGKSTPTPRGKSPLSESKLITAKVEPCSDVVIPRKTASLANDSASEASKSTDDESSISVSLDDPVSAGEESKSTNEDDSGATSVGNDDQTAKKTQPDSGDSDCSTRTRDNVDTEAEESDSSRSTTKSTSASETASQKSDSAKRQLVSVKKLETINAMVPAEKSVRTPVPIAPKPVPGLVATSLATVKAIANLGITSSTGQLTRKITDTKMEMIRSMKSIDSRPKNVISVKNIATLQAPPLAPISSSKKDTAKVTVQAANDHDFSLDNVKDEPVDIDPSPHNEEPVFIKQIVPPPPPPPPQAPTRVTVNKPILPKSTPEVTHRKRSLIEEADAAVTETTKKSKNDTNCRTVNITENVTISLINNQTNNVVENASTAVSVSTKPQIVQKPKQAPKPFVVTTSATSSDSTTQTVTHAIPIPKPVRIAPAPTHPAHPVHPAPTPIRMFTTTAQQQRIVNGNAAVNGTAMPPRSNILVVQSPKVTPKAPIFGQNGTGDIMAQFMSELINNSRRAMEDALDKVSGKGDLRAKVILLQKEIESMKKSHDMIVDEIKRDYEVQIAELRAASLAQKKYDLAHERLKFEKEKEQAVKEAKSKQWCSNCQKSANYYCCWNTAYCDFECQKEHWNQHMHVCKNDVNVKRKAAECSENEPPRIMMQNEAINEYKSMMNGYDKMTTPTYAYQNSSSVTSTSRSNGVTKVQHKSNASKSAPRPLLPRVTATVTCSPSVFPSSTPAVTATLIDNSYQNISSSGTPLRSTMIGSVNVHPFVRQAQQQFHK
ncbi:MYND-type zinc finger-containing chromatin reader ZMYND8-like isoform X2 [Planococcus citri]|uniref:MYND-type zinc finger-containing chromatin reader ZMYND8-like isoform X2 n=1 Tax=Planococcus citri TaxID=170843 RepID=UPI0031F761E8